jgi:hypothetical protein
MIIIYLGILGKKLKLFYSKSTETTEILRKIRTRLTYQMLSKIDSTGLQYDAKMQHKRQLSAKIE